MDNIKRDLSKVFEEMESDELSLETTVPTDLSLSADEAERGARVHTAGGDARKKKVSKQLLERKQLLHDLQVQKIELSQKTLIIDNMKAENMQTVEELEEKLGDAIHQKQILQARLENELKLQQDEARKRQSQIQKELDIILKRQKHLEGTNERLQEKAGDVRKTLRDVDLTESQYYELRAQNEDELGLRDYFALKLYEGVHPWKTENEELKARYKSTSEELHKYKVALEKCQEALEEEKQNHSDLQFKHQKLSLTFADTKSQVQHGDYKIENYDRVKNERDSLEHELTDAKKQLAYLETAYQATSKEREEIHSELAALKQQLTLLKQDKDYFSRQVNEITNKLLYSEDRQIQLNAQCDRAKESREELYDKYVASRDQYKTEYEAKLRDELEQIRLRTSTEIDQLKTSTREMFERENRNLRDAREMALSERDSSLAAEKESAEKYERLLQEFRSVQLTGDKQVTDLQNEVKLKAFESERVRLLYEETVRNLKDCQLENEKLHTKLEVLTKEYYALQGTLERRVAEAESLLGEKNSKLETYENLEQELDNVVMQTAEIEDETEAERVLFSYGYGANVPTTSRRRLQQSVHLARRVLQLERANTSMRNEIQREKSRCKDLADEVRKTNELLDQSQQPYHYMVESIRLRDSQITKQKQHITAMEQDLGDLEKQRDTMSKAKNQLAADLERLLNHREEMAVMKQVVVNMSQGKKLGPARTSARDPTPRSARKPKQGTAVHQPHREWEMDDEDDTNIHKPPPTQFTRPSKTAGYV